jgi:hypothetical protein
MPINPLQALVRKETPDPGNAPAERQRHCRLPGPSPIRKAGRSGRAFGSARAFLGSARFELGPR